MSATDDTPPSSCPLASCLPSRRHRADKDAHEENLQKDADDKRTSVYYSAKKSLALTENELAVIQELEEAVVQSGSPASRDSEVFFDAVDQVGRVATSMTYRPATLANPHPRASLLMDDPKTLLRSKKPERKITRRRSSVMQLFKAPRVRVELQGYPGDLTESEVEVALKFRSDLVRKAQEEEDGKSYQDMVHAFYPVEEEPYALCRFLRARNFVLEDVMQMMDDGVDRWREGQRHDFYPDADEAVGAPISILLSQFPYLFSGSAKNGCPIAYFKAGRILVEGIECVTELDDINNFVWHLVMHVFPKQVAKAQEHNPDVVRCEVVNVFDLKGLRASSLNSRTLDVLKNVIKNNVCFPEMMNCMVILNAPTFFSWAWKVIRQMLYERTASKIHLFSNEKKGLKWLNQFIDESELLSDYGGKALSFDEVMRKQGHGIECRRQLVELLSIAKHGEKSYAFELKGDEKASVQVYTRSAAGADVSVLNGHDCIKTVKLKNASVSNENDVPAPFCTDIASDVNGPGKFKVSVKAKQTDYFLVAVQVN